MLILYRDREYILFYPYTSVFRELYTQYTYFGEKNESFDLKQYILFLMILLVRNEAWGPVYLPVKMRNHGILVGKVIYKDNCL